MPISDPNPYSRNLTLTSLGYILYWLLDASPVEQNTIQLILLKVHIGDLQNLKFTGVVFLSWFLWRFWHETKEKYELEYFEFTKKYLRENKRLHDQIIINWYNKNKYLYKHHIAIKYKNNSDVHMEMLKKLEFDSIIYQNSNSLADFNWKVIASYLIDSDNKHGYGPIDLKGKVPLNLDGLTYFRLVTPCYFKFLIYKNGFAVYKVPYILAFSAYLVAFSNIDFS